MPRPRTIRCWSPAAVELVALIGDAGDAHWLHDLLAHPHPAVRAAAAFALGRLGDEDDALALADALRDPDPEVRVGLRQRAARDRRPRSRRRRCSTPRAATTSSRPAPRRGRRPTSHPLRLREAAHRCPDEPHLHEANGQLAIGAA